MLDGGELGPASQIQVEPKRVLELREEPSGELANPPPHPLDCDGAHLLSLRFGVSWQSAFVCGKKNLKGIDAGDVGSQRDDGDHSTVEARRGCIRPVVTDDDRGSAFACFRAAHRLEVDFTNLTSSHSRLLSMPSATAESQISASPLASHSSKAAA